MKGFLENGREYYVVVPIIIAKVKIKAEKPIDPTGVPISIDIKEVDWKMLEPEYIPVDEVKEIPNA